MSKKFFLGLSVEKVHSNSDWIIDAAPVVVPVETVMIHEVVSAPEVKVEPAEAKWNKKKSKKAFEEPVSEPAVEAPVEAPVAVEEIVEAEVKSE